MRERLIKLLGLERKIAHIPYQIFLFRAIEFSLRKIIRRQTIEKWF